MFGLGESQPPESLEAERQSAERSVEESASLLEDIRNRSDKSQLDKVLYETERADEERRLEDKRKLLKEAEEKLEKLGKKKRSKVA